MNHLTWPYTLVLLLGLVCLADSVEEIYVNSLSSNADGIRYLRNKDEHMIYTSPLNYGLISPNRLSKLQWKSISVSGNNVVAYDEACKPVVTTVEKLGSVQQATVTVAAAEILAVGSNDKKSEGVRSLWFVNKRPDKKEVPERDHIEIDTDSVAISMFHVDEHNFSCFIKSLPNGLERVFLIGEHVGFVYQDGRVDLKPDCALTPAERRLLEIVLTTVRVTEQHMNFFNVQAGRIMNQLDGLSFDGDQLMQEMHHLRRLLKWPRPDAKNLAAQLSASEALMSEIVELRIAKQAMLGKMRSALQETLYNVDHNFQLNIRSSMDSHIGPDRAANQ